jgi:hypothetical protein
MKLTSGAGPIGEATRIARGGSTGSIAGMVNHLTWGWCPRPAGHVQSVDDQLWAEMIGIDQPAIRLDQASRTPAR